MASQWSAYRDFMVRNNVVTVAAAITFGQATLQLIKSFVADMLMPAVYLVCLAVKDALGGRQAAAALSGGAPVRAKAEAGAGAGAKAGAKAKAKAKAGAKADAGAKAKADASAALAAGTPAGFLATVLVHKELQLANFIAEAITYVLVLFTAYVLLNYLFRNYAREGRAPKESGDPVYPASSGSMYGE